MGNLPFVEKDWRNAAYISSAAISVLFIALALIIGHYHFTPSVVPVNIPKSSTGALITDNLIALGTVIGLTPVAVVAYINYRFFKSVEANLPRFLRDVLQGTDSGLILPAALLEASKQDYGPVSFQMGIAMTKFGMGEDFSTAVEQACKKLKHPYAPQAGQIIAEAYAAGGKTHAILSTSVSLFNDLEQYSEQRTSELKPYTQLVYISIGIYLVIALIIINNFIGPFLSATAIQGTRALQIVKLPSGGESYFLSIFYISAIAECVSAGLVSGKIVDRSAAAGLRHSIALIVVTMIAFSILGAHIGYAPFP
jgi:flagellar protein FlaJ